MVLMLTANLHLNLPYGFVALALALADMVNMFAD